MNPHVSGSQATVAVTACQPACERCVPPADRPLTCHGPAKNPADHGFCKRLTCQPVLLEKQRFEVDQIAHLRRNATGQPAVPADLQLPQM